MFRPQPRLIVEPDGGVASVQAGLIDERLITALYDNALYEGDWNPALERFRSLLNSAEGALCEWREGSREGQVNTSGHLLTPEVREPYIQYYGSIDPKLGVLYRNQIAYLFNDARHFDNVFVARNPFYQEYTRSLRMRHTLDMTLDRPDGYEVFLAVMRGPAQGPYDRRAEAMFRQCAQHFLRVAKLRKKVDRAQRSGLLAGGALEALRIGIIVVDTERRVVISNRAAEESCLPGEELLIRNGRLTARSTDVAHCLEAAVREALRKGGASSVLRLPRAAGGNRMAWVAPLPAERNIGDGPGALVLIGDTAEHSTAAADDLAAIYGLTAAEAELAVAIGNGATLGEAAARRGVKLSTVRSQMLSVLQKTGARRQADLVRLLSTFPGAVLRNNQSH